MTMITILQTQSRDAYPALIAGLEAQYGREGSVEIACRFLDAELADFHWQSRTMERHLGRYEGAIDEEAEGLELDRIAILGVLKGAWFVATCIVDGDGAVHEIMALRLVNGEAQAREAFERVH
ncbi:MULTISPECIES: hypothetical protein [unclassified Sphingomonas]|jgi:hypothetical protein|uniref:hypothetical protein n=1 Tax=unclassified Sphingomonas TaxID=196159 RepID=UPI00082FDD8B|nr:MULTISPECIES: hypothetical protein [unclassified Sphingomonas]